MTGKKKRTLRRGPVLICLSVALAAAFVTVFIHGGYLNKVLAKLGLQRNAVPVDWITGWDRCLKDMGVDADVVFFGDSITSGGNFNAFFPDVTVCNLGVPGDTIRGMTARIKTAAAVKPEKIFILGGINSLCDSNFDEVLNDYGIMLDKIRDKTDAEIYIQGILPVSTEQEKKLFIRNTTITRFNQEIQKLAAEKGYTYIDLPGRFMKDGAINPAYTTEGIHLSEEGYRVWADTIAGHI